MARFNCNIIPVEELASAVSVSVRTVQILGSLSKAVVERRASTGSRAFSVFLCLDARKFVLPISFTVRETIWPKKCAKPPPKNEILPIQLTCIAQKRLCLRSLNILYVAWNMFLLGFFFSFLPVHNFCLKFSFEPWLAQSGIISWTFSIFCAL